MSGIDSALLVATAEGVHAGPIFGPQPTALVSVHGRTVLDRIVDRLEVFGIGRVVVQAGAGKAAIESHLARHGRPSVGPVLDAYQPMKAALGELGPQPFFLVSGDAFWLDGYRPALTRLAKAWSEERVDALLMLYLTPNAVGYAGMGDFALDPFGRARFRPEREVVPHAHTGVSLVHPRLFKDGADPIAAFPQRLVEADASGRLGGMVHDGLWFRLSSVEDLEDIEGRFRRGEIQYGPG